MRLIARNDNRRYQHGAERKVIVELREGEAPGHVIEPIARGKAEARPQRRDPIRIVVGVDHPGIGVEGRERNVAARGKIQMQIADIALDAGDPGAGLPVVARLRAACETERPGLLRSRGIEQRNGASVSDRAARDRRGHRIEPAPGNAGIQANVEAAPVMYGRRHWCFGERGLGRDFRRLFRSACARSGRNNQ